MFTLSQWLTVDCIQFSDTITDWQSAIRQAGQPLIDRGVIRESYVQSIIKQKEQLGPYFVIAPRIALPHARPEEGALALGLSLLKLKQGINFDSEENDPVDVIFMFSAPDSNSHIEMISQLAELLSDEEVMAQLYQAQNQQQLIELLVS
ncbi:PTS sugar transporter subunit IIA [Erwiniaceae bacterium BAC15a-03b]|uniref:PTS sugar transporter subunit IIA n=1 Tax=Winslowiella arboricola TaxID=2978220 RepID=A0A9J6Q237_9GAMM|nr:PTS sugar transporter subunit IIA [Winslowiella arboricola]MCU5775284.1 PTS sugar transporter subunit IIA [Winslowiella arboricola]MCU5780319.1 PTS sugar transporter subunit IIA [Winslowiella arboricola]